MTTEAPIDSDRALETSASFADSASGSPMRRDFSSNQITSLAPRKICHRDASNSVGNEAQISYFNADTYIVDSRIFAEIRHQYCVKQRLQSRYVACTQKRIQSVTNRGT